MTSRYSSKVTDSTVVVNRANFTASLPAIQASLQKCIYSSIDLEMTGIFGSERNSIIDDITTRYAKMVSTATRYSIIQFGLCCFLEEEDGSGGLLLRATPYSFYIFSDSGSDVVLSPGSIKFLKDNNMDFSKWIYEGLPFVGAERAADMRAKELARLQQIEQRATADAGISTLTPSSPKDLDLYNQHVEAIKTWHQDRQTTEPYTILSVNSFLRRCFYEYVESRLPSVIVTKDPESPNGLVLKKVTQEELALKRQEDADRHRLSLGFRLVFEAMCASTAPLVLHNGLFDLMFTFRWFDSALPADYESFRTLFASLLPSGIFDTKYISTALLSIADGEGTSLEALYSRSQQRQQDGGFSLRKGDSHQFHDAGYDAFCTGAVFASYVDELGGSLLALYAKGAHNQMYLMQTLYNHSLAPGSEPCSRRIENEGRIFVLYDFPDSTKTDHVTAALLEGGIDGSGARYRVVWIDGSSLMVVLTDESLPSLETVVLPEGWKVLPHDVYLARIRSPCGAVEAQAVKRQRIE